jgi:hypothetical protein
MKEFAGITVNQCLVKMTSGSLEAQSEIVLVFTEPQYRYDGDGSFIKTREVGNFRFSATRQGLRLLIKALAECEKDAGDLEEFAKGTA